MIRLKCFIIIVGILNAQFALAEDGERANYGLNEKRDPEKCKAGIEDATTKLKEQVDKQGTSVSSTMAPTPSNPIAQLIQKMGENQAKMSELEVKRLEELKKIDNEQYQKGMELQDKLHEFRRGDYQRRQEINNAENEKEKAKSDVRIACSNAAKEEYEKLLATNQVKAAQTRFETSNLGEARGTRNRMKGQRNYFYQKCLADPASVEKINQIENTLLSKMKNFKIKAEEISADIKYTEGKIPALQAHMNDQRAFVEQSSALRMEALQKQQDAQMMAMMMQSLSIASTQDGRNQSAGQFNSAAEVLQNLDKVWKQCNQSNGGGYAIPANLVSYFRDANKYCNYQCVQSNGQIEQSPQKPKSNADK